MITLFLLEGIWLWGAFALWAVLLGACVYNERYSLATFDVVALVALLTVTGNFHPAAAWEYCLHNPVIVIVGIVGYFALGVVWARIKWSLLTNKLKTQVDKWRASIGATNKSNTASFEKAKAAYDIWKDKPLVERRNSFLTEPVAPDVKTLLNSAIPYELSGKITVKEDGRLAIVFDRFKSRIMGWIGYWPMSVLLWVIGDFIHDVLEQIVRMIRSHFTFSADRKLNS